MVALADRCRRCSCISDGPVAQLSPKTSGRRAPSAVRAAPISEPSSMVPVCSIVTWSWSGTWRPTRRHGPAGADDRGLGGQQVEVGLGDEQVDPALQQAPRHDLVGVAQLDEADLAQRRRLGARPHGAGHEPVVAVGDLAGHAGRGQADLVRPVGDVVLVERHGEGAEGVGLDDVGADLEERLVQVGDDVGAGDRQDVGAALELGAAEVVGGEPQLLEVGAGGTVVHDDALVHEVEEAAHRCLTRLPSRPSGAGVRFGRRIIRLG